MEGRAEDVMKSASQKDQKIWKRQRMEWEALTWHHLHLLGRPGGDENGGGPIWRANYWEFLRTDKDENPHISEAQQIPSSITFKTQIDTSYYSFKDQLQRDFFKGARKTRQITLKEVALWLVTGFSSAKNIIQKSVE